MEAYESTFDGHSMDISPDKETVMTLISGTYYLTRYSSFGPDMERKIQKQIVKVVPGELTTIEIPFYISENKYSQRENDPATTEGRYNYSGLDSDITPLEAW